MSRPDTAAGGARPTSSNALAEVKRRTKVIGRFPGETSCLTLVWAVLDLYITHATNGVRFNHRELTRRQIVEGEHGRHLASCLVFVQADCGGREMPQCPGQATRG